MIIIHTTTHSKKAAKAITKALLKSRLVACVQQSRIKSHYIWNDKIQKESEYLLVIKSLETHKERVERLLASLHSYECPQILSFSASANESYQQWLQSTIK